MAHLMNYCERGVASADSYGILPLLWNGEAKESCFICGIASLNLDALEASL